jgi:nucleolar protein 12
MTSTTEDLASRTVLLSGLPGIVCEEDLFDFFRECGTVVKVHLERDPETRKPNGDATVLFDSGESADRAVTAGLAVLSEDGRRDIIVRVTLAASNSGGDGHQTKPKGEQPKQTSTERANGDD